MPNQNQLKQLQQQIAQLTQQIENIQQNCDVNVPPATDAPVFNPNAPFVPDFAIPELAPGGGDYDPAIREKLGPLAPLIGTWVSSRFAGFNVMPIPQATAPNGFILKNFNYYEVMTFSAIQGKVANRGGKYEQDCFTLFYEQRVFFADGPQKDQLVHAENGSWLHLITGPQGQGPLNTLPNIPTPPAPEPIPQQPDNMTIVKQVSVPHGNSILAMGGFEIFEGAPEIPVVSTLPDAPDKYFAAYGTDIPTNLNINPNYILEQALENQEVIQTTAISVDSDNNGGIENVPFIKNFCDTTRFTTTYWLEQLANGQIQLQYTQNISLEFLQGNRRKTLFPHVTANTLYKVR